MILKLGNKKIDFFNEVNVSLQYDSVASVFSFSFYFDPENPEHKAFCRPCSYATVLIEHNNSLLLTGTLLNVEFESSAVPSMIRLSGYSKTGVLEDCNIPKQAYPLQSNSIHLKDITEKILKPFGLKLIVDDAVKSKVEQVYKNTTGGNTQSVKSYLTELASQRHVLLSHNEKGDLVFTEAKANQVSVFDFDKATKGISFKLTVEGQRLHSSISVQRQANKKKLTQAIEEDVFNPIITTFRPRVERQTSGDDLNTSLAAKALLSQELQAIKMTITMESWEINGKIIRPNNVVTVLNGDVYCYNRTKWFVEKVDFTGDQTKQTAVLTCVLPEVYNGGTPKNIF